MLIITKVIIHFSLVRWVVKYNLISLSDLRFTLFPTARGLNPGPLGTTTGLVVAPQRSRPPGPMTGVRYCGICAPAITCCYYNPLLANPSSTQVFNFHAIPSYMCLNIFDLPSFSPVVFISKLFGILCYSRKLSICEHFLYVKNNVRCTINSILLIWL